MTVNSSGLTSTEAAARLAQFGPNSLPESDRPSILARFLSQFKSPLIYLLLAALALDLGVWIHEGGRGVPFESIAIALILLLNSGLGTLQEYRAESALRELRKLAAPHATVLRDGRFDTIPAMEIVPGDIVRFEAGDRVAADGILLPSESLRIDESIVTGESVPVDRSAGENVLSGTLVVRGTGLVEVTKTGKDSTLGMLATTVESIDASLTPLERRLRDFGKRIAVWVSALAVVIVLLGLGFEGLSEADRVVMFAVALAVAAVPEGLPAVLTLTLAMGVQRMSARKAVIRRMAAVEALGSVTVIVTDKTGTLTENLMVVERLICDDMPNALLAAVLANDASSDGSAGDPVDLAFIKYALDQAIDVEALRTDNPIVSKIPFDSEWKYERVTVGDGRTFVKGAPEAVMSLCGLTAEQRERWMAEAERQAFDGFRVLALAHSQPGQDLALLGLAMLWDPPRSEVPDAVRLARSAGIRVVMVTGDHPGTARAVSDSVGIVSPSVMLGDELAALTEQQRQDAIRQVSIFARVTPDQKLMIVSALQAQGEIVAVTGDGVNDAPALKKSDVGVAMGIRGSAISREVSDLVLLDDNFATIVAAIEEGRSIYENIQKFIRFLLSTNVALVALITGGIIGSAVLGLRDEFGHFLLPLTAVQLLWINFVADGPPALALAFEKNPGVMSIPPRPPKAPLMDRPSLLFIGWSGALKAGVGLLILLYMFLQGVSPLTTITVVFLYESISQLLFAYPAKNLTAKSPPNLILNLSVVGGLILQVLTVLLPSLRAVLGLQVLTASHFLVVVISILLTVGVTLLMVALMRKASERALRLTNPS